MLYIKKNSLKKQVKRIVTYQMIYNLAVLVPSQKADVRHLTEFKFESC